MLTLEELMSTRTVSFEENGFLIDIFSINGKTEFVVNPDEFRTDLEKESENYQCR